MSTTIPITMKKLFYSLFYFSIILIPFETYSSINPRSESKAIKEIKAFMLNSGVKAQVTIKKNFNKHSPTNISKEYIIEINEVNLKEKSLENFSSSVIPMSCYILYSNIIKDTKMEFKKIRCKITSKGLIEKKDYYSVKELYTASLCMVNALRFTNGLIVKNYDIIIAASKEGLYDKSSAKELFKYFRSFNKKNGEIKHLALSGFHFYKNFRDELRFQAYIFIKREFEKEVHKVDVFVDTETKMVVGIDL